MGAVVGSLLTLFFDAPPSLVACLMLLSAFGMVGSVFVKAFYDPHGGDKKEEP